LDSEGLPGASPPDRAQANTHAEFRAVGSLTIVLVLNAYLFVTALVFLVGVRCISKA